jgi:ribosomal protein S18 acetylase RimI-like enzyme
MLVFSAATTEQRSAALQVWRTANIKRGHMPSPARIARVREKLHDQSACLVVGSNHERVIAMALIEPGRAEHGQGVVTSGVGHISMVFVDPEHWGQGIGGQLLDAVHREMGARDWSLSSLWTRADNLRARRLYEGHGYRNAGDVQQLSGGAEINRYQLELDATRSK